MFNTSVSSSQTSKVWVYDLSWRQCENVNGHVNKKLRIIIRKKYVFHHSLGRSIIQNNWNKQSVKSWLGQARNKVGNVLISQTNLAIEVIAIASLKTIIGIYFCRLISLNFKSCLSFVVKRHSLRISIKRYWWPHDMWPILQQVLVSCAKTFTLSIL